MNAMMRLICLAVLFALVHQLTFAQGVATGDLHVTVRDPKGSLVVNATVTVRDAAKGLERTGTGDGQGGYSVRLLPPGVYSVTVEAAGFTNARASLEVAHGGLRVWPHPTVDGARIESLGLESLLSGPDVACRDHATPARRLGFLVLAGCLHVLIATWGVHVTMRGLDDPGTRAPGDG